MEIIPVLFMYLRFKLEVRIRMLRLQSSGFLSNMIQQSLLAEIIYFYEEQVTSR